jgi:hypothetical protein
MKMGTSIKPCVCEYLNPDAKDLIIADYNNDVEMWYVPYKKEYTLRVYTSESGVKIPINFCPFCGRKLTEE